MSENTNIPTEPNQLSDDELNEVTGGTVITWNSHIMNQYAGYWNRDRYWPDEKRPFDFWLDDNYGEGQLRAYQGWSSQSHNDVCKSYFDDATGRSWSKRFFY